MKEYKIKVYKSFCRLIYSDTYMTDVKQFKDLSALLSYIEKKEHAKAAYVRHDYSPGEVDKMFRNEEEYTV